MAYIQNKMRRSQMKSIKTYEGETIEQKVERLTENKEPIKDGAPLIYTERSEGVVAGYNIRTDRWEVAAEAMDVVSKSIQAKRDELAKQKEEAKKGKVVDMNGNEKTEGNGTTESKGEGGA